MKLCIPVEQNELDLKYSVAPSFQRASYYCLANLEGGIIEIFSCEEIYKKYKTNNIVIALQQDGLKAIISSHISAMSWNFFRRNNIDLYNPASKDIKENINLYKANQLKELTADDLLQADDCHSACSSCEATCPTKN